MSAKDESSAQNTDNLPEDKTAKAYDLAASIKYKEYAKNNISATELAQWCHCLVYEYLLIECHDETALILAGDSDLGKNESMDVDMEASRFDINSCLSRTGKAALATLQVRKKCRELITQGDILQTCALIESSFPDLVNSIRSTLNLCSSDGRGTVQSSGESSTDKAGFASIDALDLWFELQCQQFIELVRRDDPERLAFAQEELGKFSYVDSKYMDTLQDIIALFAYKDPESSPCAHFLQPKRRNDVASFTNLALIQYMVASKSSEASNVAEASTLLSSRWGSLEKLARQAIVVRQLLHSETSRDKKKEKTSYPPWSFSSFLHYTQTFSKRLEGNSEAPTLPSDAKPEETSKSEPNDVFSETYPASLQPQESQGGFSPF